MATSTIKDTMGAMQSYTVNFQNVGDVTLYRKGNLGIVQLDNAVLYNIPSGTKVMTLPIDLAPMHGFRAFAVTSSGTVAPLQFVDNKGGSVYATVTIPSGVNICCAIVYKID